jgi:hypothetical protein
MRVRVIAPIAAFLAMAMVAPRLYAFCFEPKIRVDDEFFVSDVVFAGTIVANQKTGLTPDGFFDGWDVTWRIDRVFRGPISVGGMMHIVFGNDSGRFPFDTKVGRHFLIFAVPYSGHKGKFAVDSCGNSGPLSRATSTISEIRDLPHRDGGLLYGAIYDGDEEATIVATGAGHTYSTVSGRHGKFSLRVTPGVYTVTATKKGHVYTDFDLAYKHANAVTVPVGGSAGVAFREQGR